MKFPDMKNLFSRSAPEDHDKQLAELRARQDGLAEELAAVEQRIADTALDAESGAAELARLHQQRGELRQRIETVTLATAQLHRRIEAAAVAASEEERRRRLAQLRKVLNDRLELAQDAEKLMRQLSTTLAEMAQRAAESDQLSRTLAPMRDRAGNTIARERPFDHGETVARFSKFAAGVGLLEWLDRRYLSQVATDVMNVAPEKRPARTPPLTQVEAGVHDRILAVVAPEEDEPAERDAA